MRRSFREQGGASNVLALLEAGVPLVDTQADLTPFQRMVLIEAIKEKNEEQEKAANGNGNGGGGHGQVNDLRQPNGGQGETTKFINTHTEPEE